MDRTPSSSQTRTQQLGNKFTRQQITILVLIGVLNVLLFGLGIVAWSLTRPPNPPAQSELPSAAQPLPPTWTPAPSPTAQTPALNQPPPLPPECDSLAHDVQQGMVTRIINRETLEVNISGALLPVTLAGIMPPDTDVAIATIQAIVEGQPVTLVKDETEQDSNGNLVRYVFTNGRFLNYDLVRQGLARSQPDSPDKACATLLQQAEQQARAEGVGLWKPTPIPTATFIPFVTLDPNRNGDCDCSVRYECSDFRTHDDAQACYNLCNDYSSRLDQDRDGIACENLP